MVRRFRQRGPLSLWQNCIALLPENYSRNYVEKEDCCPDGGLVGMFPSGDDTSTPPDGGVSVLLARSGHLR